MVCCPSTRLLRRHKCRRTEPAGRDGTAITAAAAVRSLSAATFCNAAAARGAIEEDVVVTIPPDLEAQILRYYHAERWRVGTIAKQLRVHRDTVARVLAQAGLPHLERPPRPSKIDPYLPFIHETLTKFPTLRASRLFAMVQERGYRGGPSQFRHIIACHRPRPPAEAASLPMSMISMHRPTPGAGALRRTGAARIRTLSRSAKPSLRKLPTF